ncbi:MAG: Sip1-related alpha-galactosidase, partial [Bacteroidales bacterium]|nr:Sip1-related alpha-galactosidase [Bacteroidales bacterium]
DMFESNNTYGYYHAIARAISGGPVYITDIPGKQNFDVLWPLIDKNGYILRADQPALLTEDCLFQLQDNKPLKAFSFSGNSGLMAVFNAADADSVKGTVSPADVQGLSNEMFAVYEFFSKEVIIMKLNEKKPIKLNRMGCQYYHFVPLKKGVALIGLVNKYNAPKTILSSNISDNKIEVRLLEGGLFKAVLPSKPKGAMVNGVPVKESTYQNGVWTATIVSEGDKEVRLIINRE